jgi:hypothetical protein
MVHDEAGMLLVGSLEQVRHELVKLVSLQERMLSRDGVAYKIPADVVRVELRPANRYRHMVTVYNDSTATLSLMLGSNASLEVWTVRLASGDYYETPAGYTGPITGVWTAAGGFARVTELD